MNPWLLGAMLSGGAIAIDKLLSSDKSGNTDGSDKSDDSDSQPIIGELNIVQGESESDDPTVEAVSDSEREQIEDETEVTDDQDDQDDQDEPAGEDTDTERSDFNSEDDSDG